MSDKPSNWPLDHEYKKRQAQRAAGLPLEPSVLSPVGDDMDYRPTRDVEVDYSIEPW